MIKTATISDCKKYRYTLTRQWEEGAKVLFIMLNPSTADHKEDDPTIRRCIRYAKEWGFGGLYVGNVWGFRATKPTDVLCLAATDAAGPENISHLKYMIERCSKIIVAWGNHGMKGSHDLSKLLEGKEVWCLGVNKNKSPKHPLYCPADKELELWELT